LVETDDGADRATPYSKFGTIVVDFGTAVCHFRTVFGDFVTVVDDFGTVVGICNLEPHDDFGSGSN